MLDNLNTELPVALTASYLSDEVRCGASSLAGSSDPPSWT